MSQCRLLWWAGASNSHGAALRSPNADTASQKGYNIAAMGGKNTPQRRTWQNPTTESNQREIFGQGRPMAKSSSGNGANWWVGTKSDPPVTGTAVESRFFFEGTVSATDMSRSTDAREASRIGIFGTSNSYGGSYGRVTNEALGRDLNPLGRGNGQALVAGMLNVGAIAPSLPKSVLGGGAQGNSVNNPGCLDGGCPGGSGGGAGTKDNALGINDDLMQCLNSCFEEFLETNDQWGYSICVGKCFRDPAGGSGGQGGAGGGGGVEIGFNELVCPEFWDCINDYKAASQKCQDDFFESNDYAYGKYINSMWKSGILMALLLAAVIAAAVLCVRLGLTGIALACCWCGVLYLLGPEFITIWNSRVDGRNLYRRRMWENMVILQGCVHHACLELASCLASPGCNKPNCKLSVPPMPKEIPHLDNPFSGFVPHALGIACALCATLTGLAGIAKGAGSAVGAGGTNL